MHRNGFRDIPSLLPGDFIGILPNHCAAMGTRHTVHKLYHICTTYTLCCAKQKTLDELITESTEGLFSGYLAACLRICFSLFWTICLL